MHLTVHQLHATIGGQLRLGSMLSDVGAAQLGRVVCDHRQLQAGDVFWPLGTESSEHAEEALTRGASGVVVAGLVVQPRADRWSIQVDDARQAMHKLAALAGSQFRGKAVAVSGCVGKTTTLEMIDAVLGQRLAGVVSAQTDDLAIALPLCLLNTQDGDDYALIEVPANPEKSAVLADVYKPQINVITQLDGFLERASASESESAYKNLIATWSADEHAILNGDDANLRRVAQNCRAKAVWVGRGGDCDIVATNVRSTAGRLRFNAAGHDFNLHAWGRHHLTSALTAVAVGQLFGMTTSEISEGLADFQPLPLRCEVSRWAGATLISDCSSVAGGGIRASLELLREVDAAGRRIVVCGDMLPLGPGSGRVHQHAGAQVVTQCGADMLLAVGTHRYHVVDGARTAGMPLEKAVACEDAEDVVSTLRQTVRPGDAVLIKGSQASSMQRIVQALEWQPRRRAA